MNIITSVSSDIFGEVTDGNVGECTFSRSVCTRRLRLPRFDRLNADGQTLTRNLANTRAISWVLDAGRSGNREKYG